MKLNEIPADICDYDDKGRLIHSKTFFGFEFWYEYDNKGHIIYSRDNNGSASKIFSVLKNSYYKCYKNIERITGNKFPYISRWNKAIIKNNVIIKGGKLMVTWT